MKPMHIALVGIVALSIAVLIHSRQDCDHAEAGQAGQATAEVPAVEHASATGEAAVEAEASAGEEGAAALELIHRRKSVRSYTDEAVSREDLEAILKAGMAAPTGGNRQPWVFMVIEDRERLDALAKLARGGHMLADAPAAIMVGGVPEWGIPGEANEYWVQDTSAATQNILLAVEALGLGAVWIGIYPREQRVGEVREILGLPEDVVPLNLIALGHPTGEEQPKDKWQPHRVHWHSWSDEQFQQR